MTEAKKDTKELYEMELHKEIWNGSIGIKRVPGGWIYMTYRDSDDSISSMVFVPFNNTFLEL